MTRTEHIRQLLAAGRSVADIAEIVNVTVQRVRIVRWLMRNPDYKRTWARRNREINREREAARRQRREVRRLIAAEQARAARQEEQAQAVILGPAHWYEG